MKIAHFSDLHLLSLDGVPARRFLNKRLSGWVNLRFKRSSVHRGAYVRAIAREIARREIDHVIITGDLTNLALESEFELARQVVERDLSLDASRVTIVPGNHDMYTRGAFDSRRFERFFGPWIQPDLPELAVDAGGARFPVVKLRDDVAIVALSSAVPQPPLVAAGHIGKGQLKALQRALRHPEVARRTVVVALHHPLVRAGSPWKLLLDGLRDADDLMKELQSLPSGLLLHGHLHRRLQRKIMTTAGELTQVGATSASLHHSQVDRMAAFNVYDVNATGKVSVEAWVYSPDSDTFQLESVPKAV